MAYNYKERYWSDPEFRERERTRFKSYKKGKGKIVALKNAIKYQNSEHGFVTAAISAWPRHFLNYFYVSVTFATWADFSFFRVFHLTF